MARKSYSDEERERIREALLTTVLQCIADRGLTHSSINVLCRKVGISKTFFYSFFSSKEELVLQALRCQQPKLLAYARELMEDPALSWREGVRQFLHACCYGERSGIAVMNMEEQKQLFRRMSPESYQTFREKQALLFGRLLECFGVPADAANIQLFTNLSLAAIIIRRAIPESLPMLVPEAVDRTVEVQINAIVDCLADMRQETSQ